MEDFGSKRNTNTSKISRRRVIILVQPLPPISLQIPVQKHTYFIGYKYHNINKNQIFILCGTLKTKCTP